jgi:hypothetical protein
MPRASDELRNKMDQYFGDPIDLYGPLEYLKKNNWKDNRGLLVAPPRPITTKEWHLRRLPGWGVGFRFQNAQDDMT